MNNTENKAPSSIPVENPTITIYQDPSYIEGILQQGNRGLIVDHSDASDFRTTQSKSAGSEDKGQVGANVNIPGIGGVNASLQLTADDKATLEGASGRQLTRNFRYTSAYYLHRVRRDLRDARLLKTLETQTVVEGLSVGDFVEFRAKFRPDEIISMLDVFNPDMIAAITRWWRRNSLIAQLGEATTDEEKQALILEYQTRPDADAEFAKAIAEAVRVDFRSANTREYYGAITPDLGVTAVVICDTRSFLVEDADRILDGHFTVLGKVGTPPAIDVPVLERNKVLDRIQPKAVDLAAEELRKLARAHNPTSKTQGTSGPLEEYLDLDFPSRITGISFKVIPIAIYL